MYNLEKKDDSNYVKWKESHHLKCKGNGAVKIFQKSVEKQTLIYKKYLGDGDTSSFKEVVYSEQYKEFSVEPVKKGMRGTYSETCGKKIT